MDSYKIFIENVRRLSKPIDFKENSKILESIDIGLYNDYLKLLKLGCEIIPASNTITEIYKMSISTHNTVTELIKLIVWSRKIHFIMDELHYT